MSAKALLAVIILVDVAMIVPVAAHNVRIATDTISFCYGVGPINSTSVQASVHVKADQLALIVGSGGQLNIVQAGNARVWTGVYYGATTLRSNQPFSIQPTNWRSLTIYLCVNSTRSLLP
jgi:hypothetical protein